MVGIDGEKISILDKYLNYFNIVLIIYNIHNTQIIISIITQHSQKILSHFLLYILNKHISSRQFEFLEKNQHNYNL